MSILFAASLSDTEQAQWLALLREALDGETLVTHKQPDDIDVAIVANPPAGTLHGLPRLRLIQSLWAGVDALLRDATIPADVPLSRMVDPMMNEAMAETALWAVMSLHRGFFEYARQQRMAQWLAHPQSRADEVPVAVLGLGQMGMTVARRLVRNGYRVTGWSARGGPRTDLESVAGDAALPVLLSQARIVVNLLPLTPATRGLFNARTLAQMTRGASLVNLARGGHVVEPDLLAALDSGHLSHAVLDVFDTEPLPPEHPFWTHPKVTVLPHVAAQTDPRSAASIAAANVRALREGRASKHLVDRARGY